MTEVIYKENEGKISYGVRVKEKRFDIKKAHKAFVQKLLLGMRPMGKGTTMVLIPTGYNFVKRRRVSFDIKKNPVTGGTLEFLPREKLSLVTITREVVAEDGRKYYLVVSSGPQASMIIVCEKYCSFDLTVKELFRFPPNKVERRVESR
jgi:hypothetical protein